MLPTGTGTAIVTPFTADGAVDEASLSALVDWQITEGIDFLVACGSTGEAQTLTAEERALVVTIVVAAANGRVPVLAGATDNDTSRAVAEAAQLSGLGVAGIMSAAPYYNKPTQAGLEAHFHAIADAIAVPLLLYNVPGRSAVDLKPETVAALALHPRIAGIKEASGSVRRMMDLRRMVPANFTLLCGDDDLVVPAIAAGAQGLVSVASNAAPRAFASLVRQALGGDLAGARNALLLLLPFIDTLFVEANPIPVKALLAMQGHIRNVVRLPLLPATATVCDRLRAHRETLECLRV